MPKKSFELIISALIICLLLSSGAFSRTSVNLENEKYFDRTLSAVSIPYCITTHRIGKIELSVNNNGTFGNGFSAGGSQQDCITGQHAPSCEYPKNSSVQYLFAGAFWVGAVVGRDTLVSEGADGWSRSGNEFNPYYPDPFDHPGEPIVYRSIRYPDDPKLFEGAVSEEDFISTYNDTITQDVDADYFGRPHIPLHIAVTERSFAWSYPYADDFVLFDYAIQNIGIQKLNNVYMGIYVDGDVFWTGGTNTQGHTDDICGFIETTTKNFNVCEYTDTVNIAWIADNDGDPQGAIFNEKSCPGVTATRIIRTPADTLDVSFNWWISNGTPSLDYGPREKSGKGRWKEPFRDFRTGGLGTPEGDVNKYYMLRNEEFDFDQIYTASILPTDTLWSYPPQNTAADLSDGYDTRYLLSFGPFNIAPGEKLPISFAYVGGMHLHHVINNLQNLPSNPDAFYKNLDFSDLTTNAEWADKVYDNPGIDTDSDGYAGEFFVCVLDSEIRVDSSGTYIDTTLSDTLWTKGDGVPDFRGASPPPAPKFWVEPHVGSIHIRFNGLRSETARDVFSRTADFEGYRIYIARDVRESSFSLVASYDKEDYNKYFWNKKKVPQPDFDLTDFPFTLDSLRCLYGDSCNDSTFNPLRYTRNSPLILSPDSIFYFEPQDFNASVFGVNTPIRKIYPNQPYPSSLDPDSAKPEELTPDGYLKYFEYEIDINNLLPTVHWWVNVTAFDFGSPKSGLKSLETPKSGGAIGTFALNSSQDVAAKDLKAYVYPNPYIGDRRYIQEGYEGIVGTNEDNPNYGQIIKGKFSEQREHVIHFANLPSKCTIRIYTLDGDLVREIVHNKDSTNPNASHDEWDLITRNTQLTVSGIYYWSVEDENGKTQIGKLVLIM